MTTHYALCWKLTRRDGVVMGFTNHDQDIRRSDGVYLAVPGFRPSAISTSCGLATDNFDLTGALTHESISDEDLWSGKYDGARLAAAMVDWQNPSMFHAITTVMLGDVEADGSAFRAETVGPTIQLERSIIETVSPECRAQFGDKRCKVALRKYSKMTEVVSVSLEVVTLQALVPDSGYYAYGSVTWLSGKNAGVVSAIITSNAQDIHLREPTPFPLLEGARAVIQAGCDKKFETCRGKFFNKANFRGEPYVPGIDSLVRYPGL
jgi:uncharacterized phage protein (TIGR02218 family)